MLKKGIKICFILAVLYVLYQIIDLDELILLLQGVSIYWFSLAVLIAFLDLCVMGYKWGILLHAGGINTNSLDLILVYLRSKVLMLFVPSTLGVDAYKTMHLKKKYGVEVARGAASIFIERLLGALSSIALICLLLYFFVKIVPLPFENLAVFSALCLFLILNGVLCWLLINISKLDTYRKSWSEKNRMYVILSMIIGHFNDLSENINYVFLYFYYSIAEKLLTGLAVYVCILALGNVEVDFLFVLAATPLLALLERLPISFSAIGVREGLFVFLFLPFGYGPEVAVSVALILRFSEFFQMAICSLFWLVGSGSAYLQKPKLEG